MELVNNDIKAALDITTAGRWFSGFNGKHREKGETDVTEMPRIDRLWRFRLASNLTDIYCDSYARSHCQNSDPKLLRDGSSLKIINSIL